MSIKKILFESKQSIINLGYPSIVATILYEKFDRNAPLIARWFKEYQTYHFADKKPKDWWKTQSNFLSNRLGLPDLTDLYEAANISKEEFDRVKEDKGLYVDKESSFEKDKILSLIKNEISEYLFNNTGFFRKNIIKAILAGEIKDFKPYESLSIENASEKYESKKIFQDKVAIKTYPDGWKWIDVGNYCEIIGRKMKNCGSAGVMGMDPDRTILTLFDSNNEPHVVATYSPNEQRMSGVEGKASSEIKSEYIPYVIDITKFLNANLDIYRVSSKELKIRYLLDGKIKTITNFADGDSQFGQGYFKIKTKDNKIFYTDSYSVVSDQDLKSIDYKSYRKKARTILDKVIAFFSLSRYSEIDDSKFTTIENFSKSLNEIFLKPLKLFDILFEKKRVWYGAKNIPNPKQDEYGNLTDRITADVKATFNQRTFEDLTYIEEKLDYLRKTAMFIGAGSSRIVFAISPKKVIKLAGGRDEDSLTTRSRWVAAGRGQNKIEYNSFKQATTEMQELLPRIYKAASNFDWLLTELVRPISSDDELQNLLKLSNEQYSSWMTSLSRGGKNNYHYANFFSTLNKDQRKYFITISDIIDKFHLVASDLTDLEQWGKTADGRLVLLDTGATEEILKRYY